MIDDTADAIILRWPRVQQATKPTLRQRLYWLALPVFILRLCAEIVGWLAILGFLTQI